MHLDSIKKAFRLVMAIVKFTLMPFGLTNALATFQAVVNTVLTPCLDRFVLVYLDDILVYSKTLSEHVQHMKPVLQHWHALLEL